MSRKLLCLIIILSFAILLVSPSAFAASHEQNFITFYESIIEAANKITWSSKYTFQDTEFVKDEMNGDEMVYNRAWCGDYYLVIRGYTDKTWAKSDVSVFWSNSEELTFTNGIKVGSSVDDVKAFFGEEHVQQRIPSQILVEWEEESDAGIYIFLSVENNRITSIGYRDWDNITSKMGFLFSLYDGLAFAEVTGDKVNVRESYPKGKVLFQVNKSKGDCLLVEAEFLGDGWCDVKGILNNNSLRQIPRTCYISKQFVKIRKLTIPERNLYISQYLNIH